MALIMVLYCRERIATYDGDGLQAGVHPGDKHGWPKAQPIPK